ncbi:hypothetical protein [Comamonas serinivorans]|uniref:hypothetical protein n=1 Tax=Comamonas serinivorans TaxID=1082851 RepID=UPI0012FC7E94|nr:hypothetical protein [Comamonas serinivorans]
MKMKYLSGEKIQVGDVVSLGGEAVGVVVFDYENGEFLPGFEDWSGLGGGVLVESRQLGVIHYPEPDIDLNLISRAN